MNQVSSAIQPNRLQDTSPMAGRLSAYLALSKARLSLLVLMTTATGFVTATLATGAALTSTFAWTLLGTFLAAASANAFNQVIEIDRDRAMTRTAQRPLVTGVLSRSNATVFALLLGILGPAILLARVNAASAGLALLTILLYTLVYTPLKTRTALNTFVGAVVGAVPPLIGWVGASGNVSGGGWVLAGLLFVWQIPHFLSLAWLYREDYARGGFRMLPAHDPDGVLTAKIIIVSSMLLVPTALAASLLGLGGWTYTLGSIMLGCSMTWAGLKLLLAPTRTSARRVFLASLLYLPVILLLLVADQPPPA